MKSYLNEYTVRMPKGISIDYIAHMNRDYVRAQRANVRLAGQR